jgi:1-aminocyclopropane-1-carboxylate deaminase/D-cysteine desulfhydrase-like pyridoxal-dependent ACC family enzyme
MHPTYLLSKINNRHRPLRILSSGKTIRLRHKRPHLIQIGGRAEVLVLGQMEMTHADLSEVARVVLVHVDAVVVLASGETATAWVLSVLADSSVAGGDV